MQCKLCNGSGHVWAKAYQFPLSAPYAFRCICSAANRWQKEVNVPVWSQGFAKGYKVVQSSYESIEPEAVQPAQQPAQPQPTVQAAKPSTPPAAVAPRPLASQPVAKRNTFVSQAVEKESDVLDLPW